MHHRRREALNICWNLSASAREGGKCVSFRWTSQVRINLKVNARKLCVTIVSKLGEADLFEEVRESLPNYSLQCALKLRSIRRMSFAFFYVVSN